MAYSPPTRRADFQIAIVCALPLEFRAVTLLFDECWGDRFGKAPRDTNHYATGLIGRHNVVVALLPRMGVANAAAVGARLRSSYTRLRLALIVGICGGVPFVGDTEIVLGDVVISDRLVRWRYGNQYPEGFQLNKTFHETPSKPNVDVAGLLALCQTVRVGRLIRERTAKFLNELQIRSIQEQRGDTYRYPGVAMDRLFQANYIHKHHWPSNCSCYNSERNGVRPCEESRVSSCERLGCDPAYLVPRQRLMQKHSSRIRDVNEIQNPMIHIGPVASGDTVLKYGSLRDEVARAEGVIAFEMEGAGMWEEIPSIIIKGVCDYADSHKNKSWQDFAAATAAATAKAVLERYTKTDLE